MGGEFSIVRRATDVTDGFPCSYRHPVTPSNSCPITPCNSSCYSMQYSYFSLPWPPSTDGTYRAVSDNRVPLMVFDHSNSLKSEVFFHASQFFPGRILAGLSLRRPSCVRQFPRHSTDVLFIVTRVYLIRPRFSSSFPLNYSLRHGTSRRERRASPPRYGANVM